MLRQEIGQALHAVGENHERVHGVGGRDVLVVERRLQHVTIMDPVVVLLDAPWEVWHAQQDLVALPR
ncbi:MAG: hypothetical protein AB7E55_22155 [Pigmentiphaga sp.]